jgi:hypothetical protein
MWKASTVLMAWRRQARPQSPHAAQPTAFAVWRRACIAAPQSKTGVQMKDFSSGNVTDEVIAKDMAEQNIDQDFQVDG